MKISICKLAPELPGDWLSYFDKDAFTDNDGFDFVEAYPFERNENHAYHGPLTMYKTAVFKPCMQIEACIVCRKHLE